MRLAGNVRHAVAVFVAVQMLSLAAGPAVSSVQDSCSRASVDLVDTVRLQLRHARIPYRDLSCHAGVVTIITIDAKRAGDMRRVLKQADGGHYAITEGEPGHFTIRMSR